MYSTKEENDSKALEQFREIYWEALRAPTDEQYREYLLKRWINILSIYKIFFIFLLVIVNHHFLLNFYFFKWSRSFHVKSARNLFRRLQDFLQVAAIPFLVFESNGFGVFLSLDFLPFFLALKSVLLDQFNGLSSQLFELSFQVQLYWLNYKIDTESISRVDFPSISCKEISSLKL